MIEEDTADFVLVERDEIKQFIEERLLKIDLIQGKFQRHLAFEAIEEVLSDIIADIKKETIKIKG